MTHYTLYGIGRNATFFKGHIFLLEALIHSSYSLTVTRGSGNVRKNRLSVPATSWAENSL